MKAESLWFTSPGKTELRKNILPEVKKGRCRIQTLYSAVSPGTERLVLSGKIPSKLFNSMACPYMEGKFSFPVKYGYSLVGKVTVGPKSLIGRIVHLLHPHQNKCVVRTRDAHPVPSAVPPARAVLASNLETAVNAVWDSGVLLGEKVLVIGFGIVGSLTARLLSMIPGVQVTIVENHPTKAVLAEKMGFHAADANSLSADFDMIFHASGSPEGLQLALDQTGFEGKIVELSWYGDTEAPLKLGGRFHNKRLRIISSQVSHIPAEMRPHWDKNRRKKLVFRLLENELFDQHMTHTVSFSELPSLYSRLIQGPSDGLNYLVRYPEN